MSTATEVRTMDRVRSELEAGLDGRVLPIAGMRTAFSEAYRAKAVVRMLTVLLTLVLAGAMLPGQSFATDAMAADVPSKVTLFRNVNIFNGKSDELMTGYDVLVVESEIEKIGRNIQIASNYGSETAVEKEVEVEVIDGGGRTLMPGLIDAHTHLYWNVPATALFWLPQDYLYALALKEAEATLMRGFTGIRDVSGSIFGIRRAIDEGVYPGPRIWCSGAGISMSSGHGDLKPNTMVPRILGGPYWTDVEYSGMSIVADGVPEILGAARMQFRKGADFLKMYVGGAVSGVHDPLDIAEYSFDEIKAAADEAKRWNTYLAVHTYTDAATQTALKAGAMSIEHATLVSAETVKMIVKKGAYLSTQVGVYVQEPAADWTPDQKAKQKQALDGLDNLMKLAKKYKAKIALGTDIVGVASEKTKQAEELTNRLKWFTPAEILKQATFNNAELLSWSGPRNPYPGKLGVIEEGALADILLVNGNPLETLELFNDPDQNLAVIMKNGTIYKNTIE